MTRTQIARVASAITETEEALARATRYLPEFQDAELVAFYVSHLDTLKAMLAKVEG